VAQGEGPEFKPQYHKKERKKETHKILQREIKDQKKFEKYTMFTGQKPEYYQERSQFALTSSIYSTQNQNYS
jgi:hypothetical protein